MAENPKGLILIWVLMLTSPGLLKRQRFPWLDINAGAARPLSCAERRAGPDAGRRACTGKLRRQDADRGLQRRRGAACGAQEPALPVAGREDGHRARSHVACRSVPAVLAARNGAHHMPPPGLAACWACRLGSPL